MRGDLSDLDDWPMQHDNMLQTSISSDSCVEACPLPECEQLSNEFSSVNVLPVVCSLASTNERGATRAIMVC